MLAKTLKATKPRNLNFEHNFKVNARFPHILQNSQK